MRRYYSEYSPQDILFEVSGPTKKSTGWSGKTLDELESFKKALAPFNVVYTDDFTGTWEMKQEPSKKVFMLFMSHKSGEHGLTKHNTLDELKAEVQSVVDQIEEGGTKKEHKENYQIVENIKGDGDYFELSDTTWFDVFEMEV